MQSTFISDLILSITACSRIQAQLQGSNEMSHRQHLGTVYTSYPAKDLGEKMGNNLFKAIMSIICLGLWTGAFYILAGIVNFVRGNIAGEISEDASTLEVFKSKIGLGIYILGGILVVIGVFRRKMGERSDAYKKNTRMPV